MTADLAGESVSEPGSDGAVDDEVDGGVEHEHEVIDGRDDVEPGGVVGVDPVVHAALRTVGDRNLHANIIK